MGKDLGINMELLGLAAVVRSISGARVGDAKKAVKAKALEITRGAREELRAATPVDKGNLRRATKAKSTRSGGAVLYTDRSGGSSGKGQHVHMVDKGTKGRSTKKGRSRGTMPAANYIEPVRARARARVNSELIPAVMSALQSGFKKDLK